MKPSIATVKGTREFYPEDMAVRSWLYSQLRQAAESFGYQEWDGPFLETIDLYAAKSGEELVKEQAFVFPDRSGDLITLRPELTPSLARMVAQKQNELTFPLRWWSFGPFWRYEKPQRGRTREFFQWNVDLIGPDSPEADAELVAVAATFFRQVGLTPEQVVINVNDRRLMDAQVSELGVTTPELRSAVFHLIDRRDKLRADAWKTYALEQGLSEAQFLGVVEMLDQADLWKQSPELRRFFTALDALGAGDFVRFEAGVIRGLDYYTGTVFEARERSQGGRAILGGGRYDNLVGDVGGQPVRATGFAMGDVMITLVLRNLGLVPAAPPSPAPVLVTAFDEERLLASLAMSTRLREAGLNVVCFNEAIKLPRQLKYADKIGARIVTLMGPDEEAEGMVTLKDLARREQVSVRREALVEKVMEMLATPVGS